MRDAVKREFPAAASFLRRVADGEYKPSKQTLVKMPTILSKIKSHVRAGNWKAEEHALNELQKDGFTVADAKHAILSAWEFDELTDDPSQVRYVCSDRRLTTDRL